MATLWAYNTRIDTAKLPLFVFKDAFFTYSSTSILILLSENHARLQGKGIKGTSWGPLTAGTIKEIDFYLKDKFALSISKISIPAPEVMSWGGKNSADVGRALLAGKDKITGSSKGDRLDGFAGNDTILGENGNDLVIGGAGHDTLSGGSGKDTLLGGEGRDAFVFNTDPSPATIDGIRDFKPADDTIRLAKTTFANVPGTGALSTSAFWTGSGAHDEDDRIIYNKKTGVLSYDADGIGPTDPVAFAKVSPNLKLTHADFFVI